MCPAPGQCCVQTRAQVLPGPRLLLGSEGALRIQTLNSGGVYSASKKGPEGKGCGQGGPHGWMRKCPSRQAPPRSQGRLAHLLGPRLIPRFCQQSTRTWGTGVPSPVAHSGARTSVSSGQVLWPFVLRGTQCKGKSLSSLLLCPLAPKSSECQSFPKTHTRALLKPPLCITNCLPENIG